MMNGHNDGGEPAGQPSSSSSSSHHVKHRKTHESLHRNKKSRAIPSSSTTTPSSSNLRRRSTKKRPNTKPTNETNNEIHVSKELLLNLLLITIILNIWIFAFHRAASRGGGGGSGGSGSSWWKRIRAAAAVKPREIVIEPYNGPLPNVEHMDTPVIIFTCSREQYLLRSLEAILTHHPMSKLQRLQTPPSSSLLLEDAADANDDEKEGGEQDNSAAQTPPQTPISNRLAGSPIIISQDGFKPEVTEIIKEYTSKFANLGIPLYHINHTPRQVTTEYDSMGNSVYNENGNLRGDEAYKSLAVHFGWGLNRLFAGEIYEDKEAKRHLDCDDGGKKQGREKYDKEDTLEKKRQLYYGPLPPKPQRVIVLEEDIEVSTDFFSYMNATAYLLDEDSSLLAVSAFNDNSLEGKISDKKRLLRSDFFGGLGWMVNREVWEDGIGSEWPEGYWDEWLREPEQRRGRHIIRPEVSRTYHFGVENGASDFWDGKIVSKISYNKDDIKWEDEDLSYLKKDTYRRNYWERVSAAKLVTDAATAKEEIQNGNIRVEYKDLTDFKKKAKFFGIMKDERAGVPRTAYKGVVEFRKNGQNVVFMTPPFEEMEKDFTSSS